MKTVVQGKLFVRPIRLLTSPFSCPMICTAFHFGKVYHYSRSSVRLPPSTFNLIPHLGAAAANAATVWCMNTISIAYAICPYSVTTSAYAPDSDVCDARTLARKSITSIEDESRCYRCATLFYLGDAVGRWL